MSDINIDNQPNILKILLKLLTLILTIIFILIIIYAIKLGIFQDKYILINYINKTKFLSPLIFIIIQTIQVVIPIIPGGISSLVGVLLFGSIFGFIYNYIGLILGSLIAFYLSKKYGITLLKKIFKEKTLNKYLIYINNKKFTKLFIIGIIMPGLPDDLLCYIAGISKIKLKTFIICLLIGKPISLLLYSFFMYML